METTGGLYGDSERYLKLLRLTLKEVYGRNDADEIVAQISSDILATASDDQRLLFFHAEPIATAQDVTGKAPSDAMYERYVQIRDSVRWVPPE